MADYSDNVIRISGSGGEGKGGGSSSATEEPNTLRSKAIARFVDLLCEGDIGGLRTGDAKSILINRVAVENDNGTRNHNGFSHVERKGTSDQTYMPGFENITNEQSVGLRVRQSAPIVYRTQAANLNAVRVTLNIPNLSKLDKDKGSLSGYSVEIAIDIKSLGTAGADWVAKVERDYISGKQTGAYEKSYRIPLTGAGPWLVRMRRLTADADGDATINNITIFSHITEIVEHKIAYSDSAVIGIEVDAEQFGESIARREYDIFGKLVQYPSNYNPTTRVYTGFWNGTWSYGYCRNPAWILRNICVHPRYGLNIPESMIDKWGLYELAQYCDAMVPDGFGGTEPRFVFNGEFRNQDDAYKVLQALASMMRAIVFYSAGAVLVRQDAPATPEQRVYTQANIIGEFSYSSTARKVRHNACIVQWINPLLGYEVDYEVYEDKTGAIIRDGYNALSIKAVGTTSQGQAYRQAKWAVLTDQLQTDAVKFKVGWDSANVLPGDIIEIADSHWATADFGGRLLQPNSNNQMASASCAISTWTASNITIGGGYAPGPNGAKNLIKITNSGGNVPHYIGGTGNTTAGTATFSFFARVDTTPYVSVQIGDAVRHVSFDLNTEQVRFKTSNIIKAWVENWGEGLKRCVVVFTATTATNNIYLATDKLDSITRTGGLNAWSGSASLYVGCPQMEVGAEATYPFPAKPSGTTAVMLDRDIDFTGATSPQLHLTLIDGAIDDVAGVDNTGRPAQRRVTYFSSAISGYQPETQIVTLTTAIPTAGNDKVTPLVWIFSKAQVAPRPFKVIGIEEGDDDNQFSIEAVEYDPQKFIQLDEDFDISFNPNERFSNLPLTTFCEPPEDNMRVEQYTSYLSGKSVLNLTISVGPSPDQLLRGYEFAYKRNDDNWVVLPLSYTPATELNNAQVGAYQFRCRAINRFGNGSATVVAGLDVKESSALNKGLVTSVYTDKGTSSFEGQDINLFWLSNSLSGDNITPAIYAKIIRSAGAGVSTSSDGDLVTGGTQTVSTGTVTVDTTVLTAPSLTLAGTFLRGDTVIVSVGLSDFELTVNASETTSSFAARLTTLIDNDVRYTASRSGLVITLGFASGATNAGNIASHNDVLFERYRIDVYSTGDVLKRTVYTKVPNLLYSYSNNIQDFTTPVRDVKFTIRVEDIYGALSTGTTVTISNPKPTAPTVTTQVTSNSVQLLFTPPNDPDYQGIAVYMSTTSGFTPGAGNLVYRDRGNPTISAVKATTYYLRYGFFDAFDGASITLGSQITVTTPDVTVGSRTGAAIDAAVAGLSSDVTGLIATYGSTAAAAASAAAAQTAQTAAETARTQSQAARDASQTARDTAIANATAAGTSATSAAGSATTATGQATIATQKATDAGTFASNASASASTATTAASQAGVYRDQAAVSESNASGYSSSAATSATLSAGYRDSSRDALFSQYPPSLDPVGRLAYTGYDTSFGAFETAAGRPDAYTFHYSGGQSATGRYFSHSKMMTRINGRRFRATAWVWSQSGTVFAQMYWLDTDNVDSTGSSSYLGYTSIPSDAINNTNVPNGVWTKVSSELLMTSSQRPFVRPQLQILKDNAGAGAVTEFFVTGIKIEDVTSEKASADYAQASLTSSSSAAASASSASSDASVATTQRGLAETARGQAQTSATNAATSATNAAGSQSAAGTSATNSATSAGAAAGSAGAAAGSATNSANSATASASSASAAATSSTNAGNSATAANTAKLAAEAANTTAQTAATNANNSYTAADAARAASVTASELSASYRDTAQSVMDRLFPKELDVGGRQSYVLQTPTSYDTSSSWPVTYLARYDTGTINSAGAALYFKKCVPKRSGRTLRVTAYVYAATSNCTFRIGFSDYTSEDLSTGGRGIGLGTTAAGAYNNITPTSAAFYKLSTELQVTDAHQQWIAPYLQVVPTSGTNNNILYLSGLQIEDVTSENASATSATASNTSYTLSEAARAASVTASTNSATYRDQAQGYRNEAEGFKNTAQSQAGVATTQAATATSSAAAAQTSAALAASIGLASMNGGPTFADWPTGNSFPTFWANWSGTPTRISGLSGGYALRMAATASTDDRGVIAAVSNGNGGLYGNAGYYVVEWDVVPYSGASLQAAGILVQAFTAAGYASNDQTIHLGTEHPTVTNGSHYRGSKIIQFTNTSITYFNLYAMTNWVNAWITGGAVKTVDWFKCSVRPATLEEIRSNTVIPTLQASVTTQAAAIATIDGRSQAYWAVSANAGGTSAAIEARATTNPDGSTSSRVGIVAEEFSVTNTTGGIRKRVLSTLGSDVLIDGVLTATSGIYLGSGNRWAVALKSKDYSVTDGQTVSFGIDLGNTPLFSFEGDNLAALSSGETYKLYAEASPTGFTARLRISVPGTVTNYSLTTDTTPGTGPTRQIDKASNPDSSNNLYTLRVQGSFTDNSYFVSSGGGGGGGSGGGQIP